VDAEAALASLERLRAWRQPNCSTVFGGCGKSLSCGKIVASAAKAAFISNFRIADYTLGTGRSAEITPQ
jgi:hypothetical protein